MSIEDLTYRWPSPPPIERARLTEHNAAWCMGLFTAEFSAMAGAMGERKTYVDERRGWLEDVVNVIGRLKASQAPPTSDGEASKRDSARATEPKGES